MQDDPDKSYSVVDVPNVGKRKVYNTPEGLVTDLNMMVYFRKGHETFDDSIPMGSTTP